MARSFHNRSRFKDCCYDTRRPTVSVARLLDEGIDALDSDEEGESVVVTPPLRFWGSPRDRWEYLRNPRDIVDTMELYDPWRFFLYYPEWRWGNEDEPVVRYA